MPANHPEGGIRLSTAPADMRKSFDGIAGLVRNPLGVDPASGGCRIRAGASSRAISRFPPGLGTRRRARKKLEYFLIFCNLALLALGPRTGA